MGNVAVGDALSIIEAVGAALTTGKGSATIDAGTVNLGVGEVDVTVTLDLTKK